MDRCEDLAKYLAAYADGELEGSLRARVERHVEGCEACRGECASLKRVAELYRASRAPEVPSADWAKVSAALERCMSETVTDIRTLRRRAPRRRSFGWWLIPAAGLAAAVIVAALIIVLPSHGTQYPSAQVVGLQTDPDYEPIVRLPANDDDFLIIDVVHVE